MLNEQEVMKHIWEAFSTLSDAQELMLFGDVKQAVNTINHAKRHLNEVFQQDQNLLQDVMLKSTFEACELALDLE